MENISHRTIHHISAKGKYNAENEDSLYVGDDFIIVADGIGGEKNGGIASKMAVDTISGILNEKPETLSAEPKRDIILSAIRSADKNICDYVTLHPESYGMGTTILVMAVQYNEVLLAWCGDSRCYVYSNGRIHPLTKDHSYVQNLIDSHEISIEESFSHPENNIITRYIGGGYSTCDPEFVTYTIKKNDIIILCSDGLSGYCKDSEIQNEVTACDDFGNLPERLRDLALRKGSTDDITIITFSPATPFSPSPHFSYLDWLRKKINQVLNRD